MKKSISILLWFGFACRLLAQTDIHLDPQSTFQTLKHWETMGWIGQWGTPWLHDHFTQWQDTMIKSSARAGITRVRAEVHSGTEGPEDFFPLLQAGLIDEGQFVDKLYTIGNDNADSDSINWAGFQFSHLDFDVANVVVPLKNAVESLGNPFYFTLCYVDFGASPFEHYAVPEEYAEFMEAVFLHLQQTFGFTPDGLEIILEPDNNGTWPTADGSTIAACIAAAGARLAGHGFHPEIIIPSTLDTWNAYELSGKILQNPAAAAFVREISYHKYSGAINNNLALVCARAAQYDLTTSMTEYWENGNDQYGLFSDLTQACASVWQHGIMGDDYVMAPSNAFFRIEHGPNDQPIFLENQHTRYFRQYFLHIPHGAQRIGAVSSEQQHEPTAWHRPDGQTVVVVNARQAALFRIHDLPPGQYGLRFSTADVNYQPMPDVFIQQSGDVAEVSMPVEGVFTLFGKQASGAQTVQENVDVMVFPNPTTGSISLKINDLKSSGQARAQIFDAVGKLVFEKENLGTHLEIGSLARGVYFLKIKFDKGEIWREVIVE